MSVALGDDIDLFEIQYGTSEPDTGNLFIASDYASMQQLEPAVRENLFGVCTGKSSLLNIGFNTV